MHLDRAGDAPELDAAIASRATEKRASFTADSGTGVAGASDVDVTA
jgi:hypothetical protein